MGNQNTRSSSTAPDNHQGTPVFRLQQPRPQPEGRVPPPPPPPPPPHPSRRSPAALPPEDRHGDPIEAPGGGDTRPLRASSHRQHSQNNRNRGGPGFAPPRDQFYIVRGGPTLTYPRPNGPPIFIMEGGASGPAITTPDTIVCDVNLPYRESIKFSEVDGDLRTLSISFQCDCNVAGASAVVYLGCLVSRNQTEGVVITDANVSCFPVVIGAGIGQTVIIPNVSMEQVRVERRKRNSQEPKSWPLVISLVAPENTVLNRPAHTQFTLCNLMPTSNSPPGTNPPDKVIVEGQVLQVGSSVYKLEDVFGSEERELSMQSPMQPGGSMEDGDAGQGGGGDDSPIAMVPDVGGDEACCVVCLCEPRDTTILPCRHMCLCHDCAEIVKAQNNKCPMCRKVIEQLITKK